MDANSVMDALHRDAALVFVGAHPDDETTIGPLLACAADRCREVVVVSLTKGESGWNLAREDLTRTLAQVREQELAAAARVLGCTPVALSYVNGISRAHPQGLAVLDLEEAAAKRWRTRGAGQTPEGIYARWTQEAGDPAAQLLELFREKRATVVIALDPHKGYTGHPEHVAATRAVLDAVGACNRAAEPKACLYYAYKPSEQVDGAERIATAGLAAAGGKDYLAIANASWACYESQFGPEGSEKSTHYIGRGVQECLLQPAPAE